MPQTRRRADRKRLGGVSVKAGASAPVFTRVTEADAAYLSVVAERRGMTRGLYLRVLIERALDRERREERKQHEGSNTGDGSA